jgi:hypothetical protein
LTCWNWKLNVPNLEVTLKITISNYVFGCHSFETQMTWCVFLPCKISHKTPTQMKPSSKKKI